MAEKFNMTDFVVTAECNVIIIGLVTLLTLLKKKLLAVVKIQNGVRSVFIFHPMFSKMFIY
jgi:hypothetical protein